jgi:hypothetical protein
MYFFLLTNLFLHFYLLFRINKNATFPPVFTSIYPIFLSTQYFPITKTLFILKHFFITLFTHPNLSICLNNVYNPTLYYSLYLLFLLIIYFKLKYFLIFIAILLFSFHFILS